MTRKILISRDLVETYSFAWKLVGVNWKCSHYGVI